MKCKKCGSVMMEKGRIMDYYDDYSAYMDIELMKMEDGFPESFKHHQCPHLYSCPNCLTDEVILIME